MAKDKGLKLKDLKEATYNPRIISDKRLENLKKSMRQFGDLSGIVFNKRTGTLVSGHQRLKTVRDEDCTIETKPHTDKYGTVELGFIHVKTKEGTISLPFRVVDWTDKKTEMAANIAANAHGGEFDKVKLKQVMEKLEKGKFALELTGLDSNEIRNLRNLDIEEVDDDDDSDDDDAPTSKERTKVQPTVKEETGDLQIIVTAKNDKQLRLLFDEFTKRGLKCKVLS